MTERGNDVRIVGCEACGSEGRILRGDGPYPTDYGPCPECSGTGVVEIDVEPVAPEECPHCHRLFMQGDTCWAGGCPMGGDW